MLSTWLLAAALSLSAVEAHIAPWNMGMWCLNGTSGTPQTNTEDAVYPLYELSMDGGWWMHATNGCDQFPPADGDFLEVPDGGSFTVEMGSNKGKTTLSFDGDYTTEWPDGGTYPEDYNVETCIVSPNLHTQNESMAAGTAFAISYTSDLSAVTQENSVVFTVAYNTPWKRLATYQVPSGMPACPEGGCICTWGWIPNGCGIPNMYMIPSRCMVTNPTGTKAIGTGQAPVWCEEDPSTCVTGPKQLLAWNQVDGNNIVIGPQDFDLEGDHRSPAYNAKCGFSDGAQTDIFTGGDVTSSGSSSGSSSSSSASSSSVPATTSTTDAGAATTSAAATASISVAAVITPSSSSSSASQASASCRKRKRSLINDEDELNRRSLRMHQQKRSPYMW